MSVLLAVVILIAGLLYLYLQQKKPTKTTAVTATPSEPTALPSDQPSPKAAKTAVPPEEAAPSPRTPASEATTAVTAAPSEKTALTSEQPSSPAAKTVAPPQEAAPSPKIPTSEAEKIAAPPSVASTEKLSAQSVPKGNIGPASQAKPSNDEPTDDVTTAREIEDPVRIST
ncbi:unnamed protein product [Angiostrongylus costaricensis]|uniref:Internalin n=1 Tax=Angiostrongylus costaricensis TaxID=334426 RepID=A0A0R3PN76_ANGCS|nr:unnamed protein product [Angiostrongylus costaricensis]